MIDKNQEFQLTIELESIGFTVGGVFHFVMKNERVSDESIKVWIGDVLWKMITEIDELTVQEPLEPQFEKVLHNNLATQKMDELTEDGRRLEWVLSRLPGNVFRDMLGEVSNTGDHAENRRLIDAAIIEDI